MRSYCVQWFNYNIIHTIIKLFKTKIILKNISYHHGLKYIFYHTPVGRITDLIYDGIIQIEIRT